MGATAHQLPRFFARHRILAALLKAAIFFFLFFVACEASLRFYLAGEARHAAIANEFRPHPVLFWTLRPHLDTVRAIGGRRFWVRTNSLGLRDEEIPSRRPVNQYRILCLGDSITYGHGVERAHTYEYLLQEMLYAAFPGRDIRVINGGCPGYSSFQGQELFKRLDPIIQPDLLIIAYLYADAVMEEDADRERIVKSPAARALKNLLYQSEAYLFLRSYISHRIEGRSPGAPPSGSFSLNSARVSQEDYQRILTGMVKTLQARGGQAVLVNLPKSRSDPGTRYGEYRQIMARVAAQTGALYLDLDRIFAASPKPAALFIETSPGEVDRIHPNEKGFELMARSLADLIIPSGVISNRSSQ